MRLIFDAAVKLIPIMMGYLPVGISFALVAAEAGIDNAAIIGMSVFVLGAASQIAAVPLIESEAGVFYIFLITFLVNFRHAALSASLSPHLGGFSKAQLAVFAYGLTDEAFAIHARDTQNKTFRKATAIAVNAGTHLIWVLSTAAGCYIGLLFIKYMSFIKLEFALSAMFISIIALFIKSDAVADELIQWKKLGRILLILFAVVAMTLGFYFADWRHLSIWVPAVAAAVFIFCGGGIKSDRTGR